MNHRILFAASIAALVLGACGKPATVAGSSGDKLTLSKPAAVTIVRGGMTKASIEIKRRDLVGDVSIAFTNLPRGVDVVEQHSQIVGDSGTYTLRASEDADLVENSSATVTASGGTEKLQVSQPINISVKPKN